MSKLGSLSIEYLPSLDIAKKKRIMVNIMSIPNIKYLLQVDFLPLTLTEAPNVILKKYNNYINNFTK